MKWNSFGNGLLQGAELGFGLVRAKQRDQENDRRWQAEMDFRQSQVDRDEARYQDNITYREGRDKLADERYATDLGMREKTHNAQLRNLDQQHDVGRYTFSRQKGEDARADQLREVQGWISLLEGGDDGGMVAASMNANPQYQKWLKDRGLSDAKFDSLRLNETGKGPQGVVTVLSGTDRKTGQVRRGVATQNASSDPDDPVDVMPVPVMAGMVQEKADQLEAEGDVEAAGQLRSALLKRLETYQTSLGGQKKQRWSGVEYIPNVGYTQRDPEGRIYQLDPTKDPAGGGAGGRGLGGSRSAAFTNQIYKQLSDELPDDPDRSINNSDLRTLITSVSQGIDLEVGGMIAPGAYVQAGKDAGRGLVFSMDDAVRQVQESRKGGLFGSVPDADDPAVQEQAARVLDENRMLFETRFRERLLQQAGVSGPAATGGQQAPAGGDLPLDDAVSQMVNNSQGKVTAEQARQYLTQTYPDRYGEQQVAGSESDGPGPVRRALGRAWDANVGGIKRDIGEPLGRGLQGFNEWLGGGVRAEKYGGQLRAAAQSGSYPPAKTISEWLPMLEPEDQELAVEILMKRYPDDPATKAVLQQYNAVASR